ncbi:GNAT family N-acetyltransferase [Oceanibium sediminis]|uniref:GNAT family N-acetyltransferase n=1 Tax=Oceanibium sediminis TaxID=2026339 RepID=UPI000DD30330|nr:GNAT family N-acetyltransferase [Oceanibium sediminis]
MSLHITQISSRNRALLDQVAETVFDGPLKPHHIDALLADPAQRLFVACERGVVIGQAKAVIHRHADKAPSLFIDELGVTPSQQRRGIASALVAAVMTLARNIGCAEVWLATEPENDPANLFYKARDMVGEHVVVYSRKL